MIFRNSWRHPQGELQQSRIWSYEFTLGGIRHRGSTKTENKALAKRIEAERRREQELGIARLPGPEKSLTLKEGAEVHLATNPAWSTRNLSIETYNVGKLLPIFGKRLLTEITADDIAKFQAQCKKSELGPRTTNMICGTLRQILRKYRLWSNLEQDYKPMVVRKDIGKALSPDEQRRLLAACQKSRSRSLYPAWLLTTHTGLRHNETAHLTWAQVDLIDGWIQVGRSKTAAGTGRRVPITAAPGRAQTMARPVPELPARPLRFPVRSLLRQGFRARGGPPRRPDQADPLLEDGLDYGAQSCRSEMPLA